MRQLVPVLVLLTACIEGPEPDPEATSRSLEEVVMANTPPPAIQGGTLTVDAHGSTAAVSDPDRDMVWIVDLDSSAVAAQLELVAGAEPGRIAAHPDGGFFVVLQGTNEVIRVSAAYTISGHQATCDGPRGLAYDTAADTLHVACESGELTTLPGDGGPALRTIMIERDLRDVVLVGAQLMISRFRSAQVLVVDADGEVVHRMAPPSDHNSTPAVAWRMIPSDNGRGALMVHQRAATQGAPVEVTEGGYGGGGENPCAPSIVQTALTEFSVDGTVQAGAPMSGLVLPVDIAIAPRAAVDSPRVALAAAGNLNDGTEIAAAAPAASKSELMTGSFFPGEAAFPRPDGTDEGGPSGAPFAPGGTGCPPSTGMRFLDGRQVVATAFDGEGRLITQTRDPWAIVIEGATSVRLPGRDMKDSGHDLFHENTGGGIACASCHPGGGDDGQTWTFAGFGERRTQNIAGGILGTEPFHWVGDMTDFRTLVNEVFSERMSGPELPSRHANVLATWIDTTPAPRGGAAEDPAAVERGRAVFERADTGCATCHSGARLSNNTTVDVGTGLALQVPSLIGLGVRAPYMHNGCATTLEDRFRSGCGGGDAHGRTSHLDASEQRDLVAYLGTL